MKIDIFFKIDAPIYQQKLERDYSIHHSHSLSDEGTSVKSARIAVTSGLVGFSSAEMDRFPSLGLICTVGTGYENVDVQAARARGIQVSHAAGTNAVAVADHAMGLLLASVRNITGYDASTKAGDWKGGIAPRPIVSGKKLGIIGMGDIGRLVARRAEGFDMAVSYVATAPKPCLPYTFRSTVLELAQGADYLICAAPGGAKTYHMVNKHVLVALGPQGHIVNVGRGSVVDTGALIQALKSGTIAGAALDVFETEPEICQDLRELNNVILTPHIAGVAPEIQAMSADLMERNIKAFLAGQPLVSPVPEMQQSGG